MSNMMGIINLDGANSMLKELCERRPVASLPVAGRYRVIDFAVSSMVNSGIDNVGVLLSAKARSVFDHLRSGKDWDLARHRGGLSYLPCASYDGKPVTGNLSGLYHNLDYVQHTKAEYVLFAQADSLYNIDFRQMLLFHQNTGADITMLYSKAPQDIPGDTAVMKINENGRVTDIAKQMTTLRGANDFLGIYLMSKDTFNKVVTNGYERGGTDLLLDGIIRHMDEYSIFGCEHKGYVARINSTMAYYNANRSFLKPEIWNEVFMEHGAIHTKTKDAAPVQYKETAKVTNSLIANGCVIRGEVENSILFRNVTVAEGVEIKDCIVMEHCVIEDNAMLRDVICDKNVTVSKDQWLKGAENYPLIVAKGTVI